MALAAQIQTMSSLFEENIKSAHLTSNYTNSGRQKKANIDSWYKVKTRGSVKRDRKKWYCCPTHVRNGFYDGIYITSSLRVQQVGRAP